MKATHIKVNRILKVIYYLALSRLVLTPPIPAGRADAMDNRWSVCCVCLPCHRLTSWTLIQVRYSKKDVDIFVCSIFLLCSKA